MKQKSVFLLALFCICPGLLAAEPLTASEAKTTTEVKSYVTPIRGAVDFMYVPSAFPAFRWSNQTTNAARINGFRVNFEWIPMGDMPYGKPVFGMGTGVSWVSNLGIDAGTNSSLYAIPVEPYIGYRLDYFKNQVLVPYGKVGLEFAYLQQESKLVDGNRLTHETYFGFDLAAGAELWLNFIDPGSARSLDSSTGINNVYLLIEYFKSRDLGAKWANLSREEARLGMRFEF